MKASISTATDGMAAMEKPATTSSKNKRSTSDTPYGASGENEAPGRPLIASPQCEAAQGDAKDGPTTSGESSRMAEDGKPSPVRVDATGVRQGPAGDTSTSAFPEVMLFVVETIMSDEESRRPPEAQRPLNQQRK